MNGSWALILNNYHVAKITFCRLALNDNSVAVKESQFMFLGINIITLKIIFTILRLAVNILYIFNFILKFQILWRGKFWLNLLEILSMLTLKD